MKSESLTEKDKIEEYWSKENLIQETRGYFNIITQNMLDKHLNYPSGGRIIDIGCGTGRTLERYKERGVRVSGVDLSVLSAQTAKNKGLSVVVGDARRLPIKTGFFDASISLGVFEHFAEVYTAISEQVRVTKNKGSVVVVIQNKWSPMNLFIKIFELLRGKSEYGVIADGYKYSKGELYKILSQHCSDVGVYPYYFVGIFRVLPFNIPAPIVSFVERWGGYWYRAIWDWD